MKRISSGFSGLDELIEGGFPKGSLILVAGGTGTGKSIFGGSFIYEGLKKGEKGIYVTFVDTGFGLRENFERIGMDFKSHEGNFKFLGMPIGDQLDTEMVTNEVLDAVRNMDAQRLVIDSVNAMTSGISKDSRKRNFMIVLYRILKKKGCTTLAMAEDREFENSEYPSTVRFIADGVIQMNSKFRKGELERELKIMKMKNTAHSRKVQEYVITSDGIKITKS